MLQQEVDAKTRWGGDITKKLTVMNWLTGCVFRTLVLPSRRWLQRKMTVHLSIRILRPTPTPPANHHHQPLDCFLGDDEVSREWSPLSRPCRLSLVDSLFDTTGDRHIGGARPSAQRRRKRLV